MSNFITKNQHKFSERLNNVINKFSHDEALTLNKSAIYPEDLLLGILEHNCIAVKILLDLNIALHEFRERLLKIPRPLFCDTTNTNNNLPLTTDSEFILNLTIIEADERNHSSPGTEHLLLAILKYTQASTCLFEIFQDFNITYKRVADGFENIINGTDKTKNIFQGIKYQNIDSIKFTDIYSSKQLIELFLTTEFKENISFEKFLKFIHEIEILLNTK